ncbi:hypothetical protein F5882DRAFT_415821 [Hyaloscypha sp. PMI_1271]|nr:hypothetical protein F5882DRAFT_415821 [Hyaloscypha sp. PMI_1271]
MRLNSIIILACANVAISTMHLMARDGPVSDIDLIGYIGTSYQAIRYEPLCGSLGSDSRFQKTIDMTERCVPAMQLFSNNTVDRLAFYDITGVRLKNAVVGGGHDLCMCFSLAQSTSTTSAIKADICIWINSVAQAEIYWRLDVDSFLTGSYRPGAYKALPACGSVDLDSLKASWSATAVQPSVTEIVSTLSNVNVNGGKVTAVTQTVISTSSFTPSVIDYTTFTVFTTTNSQGVLTTQTSTIATQLPVVTNSPPSDTGLSRSDKIALGVGLSISLPTIILMIIGLCLRGKQLG